MILITIGRNKDNRYVIDDPQKRLSGYHAEIKVGDDNSIAILDHSLNGTTVNGQRINKEVEVQLNRGAEVIFGGVAKLDWNRIPVLPPIAPGTKLFSVGTHLTNRIMINDGSNMVSRYHATLKIAPNGKMTISDHSANGTFVNGSRIPSNQDIPVKRRDKILFANTIPFDWARIPGAKLNPWYIIAPIAAVLVVGLLFTAYVQEWPPFKNGVIPETNIFAKYDKAVVCIAHEYRIIAELPNRKKLVFRIFDENNENKIGLLPADNPNSAQLNKVCTGTGFFVDNKGIIMTNRHVAMPWEMEIDQYKRVAASIEELKAGIYDIYGESVSIGFVLNGNTINSYDDFTNCVILSQKTDNIEKDVAILQTKDNKLPNSDICPIDINRAMTDPSKLASGQKVYVIGFPKGLVPSAMIGSRADQAIDVRSTNQGGSINTAPGQYYFGLDAQMTHGASGSPVLNDRGQLIGIFTLGLDGTQGLNGALLAKHAKELYDKAN